ncbi:N-acetyltransferase [Ferrimonas pelagia]|uniref:N-acetyltransferase n=1 Tax=Ferrimonas pelagia TaxID=1177826 RepID=A0ABP9FEN0_9GAMM
MQIRTETAADTSVIERLTYQAFEDHPHHAPGAKPTEHLIVQRLREQGALTLSLVAEDDTGIVGHIAFSPITIDGTDVQWYGLGPVSVSPARQGEGIGAALIKAGLAQMTPLGAAGVVVLGEPAYYSRFGFAVDANLTLSGVPAEYFLVQSLQGDQPLPAGVVAYHSAFYG